MTNFANHVPDLTQSNPRFPGHIAVPPPSLCLCLPANLSAYPMCPCDQVVRDEDLQEQIGNEVHVDLVDFEKVQTFRVLNETTFVQFKVCMSEA